MAEEPRRQNRLGNMPRLPAAWLAAGLGGELIPVGYMGGSKTARKTPHISKVGVALLWSQIGWGSIKALHS